MKRKSSIVKLVLCSTAIVLGFLLAFCSFSLLDFNKYTGFIRAMDMDVDLRGGISILYEAEKDSDIKNFGEAVGVTADSFSGILKDNGYSPIVQKEGQNKIRVNVANETDSSKVIELLGSFSTKNDVKFEINGSTILTGKHVKSASLLSYGSSYGVDIQLTKAGTPLFARATEENPSSTLTIMVGDNVVSNVNLGDEPITDGHLTISSPSFTSETASLLASQIMAGKYALSLNVKSVDAIASSAAKAALKAGLIASIIGLILVIVFAVYLYGLNGVASGMSAIIFGLFMTFILSVFPWVTLTLPAVVAIILSIGITFMFNTIICERIKNEYKNGKSILSSAHYGFIKSIRGIIDIGIIVLIASIALIFFGNFAVKNFAITLAIGTLLSVIAVLVLTPMLINSFVRLYQSDPKRFMFKRGKGYEDISADQNDAATERELLEKKQRAADKKQREASTEGGNI